MLAASFPFMFGSRFIENFDCFSVAKLEKKRDDVERGGKIILPQTVLECLSQQTSPSPMLFKLTNSENDRSTHVGVLEFTAEEGSCYLPHWLYCFLGFEEGDEITVEAVSLPVATFAKFQPIGEDFLDITNPKAVLENELRCFACLTTGDIITIHYNDRTYELRVLETQPEGAVSIIVCDMHVEFEPPEGYVDPKSTQLPTDDLTSVASFEGQGLRLDGKTKKQSDNESKISRKTVLECLSQQTSPSPMLFKLTNSENDRSTHVGVLEFTAEEGSCYLPHWLYCFLGFAEGDEIIVETVTLPVATFAKFQPIGEDFLDITNPKAVLENELRCFACLTSGDIITIHYNDRTYELRVLETQPEEAVSIIECDMHVEFEPPEGYVDPKSMQMSTDDLTSVASFEGQGLRLDGKTKKQSDNESKISRKIPRPRGIPDYSYTFGELRFDRHAMPITSQVFPVRAASDLLKSPTSVTSATGRSNNFPGAGFMLQEEKID